MLRTHVKVVNCQVVFFFQMIVKNSWGIHATKRIIEQKAVLPPTEQDNIRTEKRHPTHLLELH